MKKINLGAEGQKVSEICLGAMNFGTTTSEKQSCEVLDCFVDNGGNFIDTSNNYAHWAGTGDESETLLGNWLSKRGGREKLVIASKVGFDRHGEGAGLKAAQIEYWCDQSLKKLKCEYLDLYYAHTDDTNTPLEETLEAFDKLIKKGKVRAIGASNYDSWRFCEAEFTAHKHGFTPYTVMQQRFTYLWSKNGVKLKYPFNECTDYERLRLLKKYNIPLVAYSCLAKGGYADNSKIPEEYVKDERLKRLNFMAKQLNTTPTCLVIAWLINLYRVNEYPVVIPLFSSSNSEHLLENLKACELKLDDNVMEYLNI